MYSMCVMYRLVLTPEYFKLDGIGYTVTDSMLNNNMRCAMHVSIVYKSQVVTGV